MSEVMLVESTTIHGRALRIVALLLLCTATAGAEDRTPPPHTGSGLVKDPIHMQPQITTCLYAGREIPCTKLTVVYDDGTDDGGKIIAMDTKGEWRKALDALGDAMDRVQSEHLRIKRERNGERKH